MKKLLALLKANGGLELLIREHELYREIQCLNLLASTPRSQSCAVGRYQIIATSELGRISIIQSADASSGSMRFEIMVQEGCDSGDARTFRSNETFWEREECCTRVCQLLAPVSFRVAKKHLGKGVGP